MAKFMFWYMNWLYCIQQINVQKCLSICQYVKVTSVIKVYYYHQHCSTVKLVQINQGQMNKICHALEHLQYRKYTVFTNISVQ